MHVRIVIPVLPSDALVDKCRHEYERAAAPGVELSFVCLAHGTSTIESEYDLALAQPDTIRRCVEAEADGADAAIIACFGDPGGLGAKEATSIPIVGEGEAGLHVASLLGSRFAIITVRQQTVPLMTAQAARVGLAGKLASVRPVDFGVMDFDLGAVPQVVEEAAAAVLGDGADVIVMGCTGTGEDMVPLIERGLAERLGAHVPVVDPVPAAIGLAELCARHRYRPSKRAYPTADARPEYRWLGAETVAS